MICHRKLMKRSSNIFHLVDVSMISYALHLSMNLRLRVSSVFLITPLTELTCVARETASQPASARESSWKSPLLFVNKSRSSFQPEKRRTISFPFSLVTAILT